MWGMFCEGAGLAVGKYKAARLLTVFRWCSRRSGSGRMLEWEEEESRMRKPKKKLCTQGQELKIADPPFEPFKPPKLCAVPRAFRRVPNLPLHA